MTGVAYTLTLPTMEVVENHRVRDHLHNQNPATTGVVATIVTNTEVDVATTTLPATAAIGAIHQLILSMLVFPCAISTATPEEPHHPTPPNHLPLRLQKLKRPLRPCQQKLQGLLSHNILSHVSYKTRPSKFLSIRAVLRDATKQIGTPSKIDWMSSVSLVSPRHFHSYSRITRIYNSISRRMHNTSLVLEQTVISTRSS